MSSTPDPARFGPPIRLGGMVVAPAVETAELEAVLALRALVFRGNPQVDDRDGHDAGCLHLRIAQDVGAGHLPVLATLRVQPHAPGHIDGYAAACYDVSALAVAPGAALELGRLCLHPDHRHPDILRLVWAGVTRVAERWGAARLIGCTSFPGTAPNRLAPALGLLVQRHLGPPALRPKPRAHETRPLTLWADEAPAKGAAMLPPLLRAYLALGGWVSDHLVIDRDLGTFHVFTCVEIAAMPERRKRILRQLAGHETGQGG